MAEDDFLLIEGLNENHPLYDQVPAGEQLLKAELQKIVDSKEAEGRPLRPEMQKIAELTKEWIKDRLVNRFGVPEDKVHFAKTMIAVDSIKNGSIGEQIPGASCIVIAEGKINEDIDDQDLRDYLEARVIFEELWHSTATARYKTEPGKDQPGVYIAIENSGFAYHKKEGDKYVTYTAFEEGMAQHASDEFIDDLMATQLPEGHRKFFDYAKKNNIRTWDTSLIKQKGDNVQFGVTHQGPRELASEVLYGGFKGTIGLLERARITHETISLAREIEQIYGKGSYKMIMTASEESASDVAKELTQMRINIQNQSTSEKSGEEE